MTSVVWTGDDLVAVTPSTSITTVASNNAGYFTTGFGATGFAPDQNIENEGPWTATFDLVFNTGYTGTLTSIEFDYQSITNTGANQGSGRSQNFDVTVNGTVYDTTMITSSTSSSGSLLFTDTAPLLTGSNLIAITAAGIVTTGWNMGIDNLTFNGDIVAEPVPEPTTIALWSLLGMGLVALRRYRRK